MNQQATGINTSTALDQCQAHNRQHNIKDHCLHLLWNVGVKTLLKGAGVDLQSTNQDIVDGPLGVGVGAARGRRLPPAKSGTVGAGPQWQGQVIGVGRQVAAVIQHMQCSPRNTCRRNSHTIHLSLRQ